MSASPRQPAPIVSARPRGRAGRLAPALDWPRLGMAALVAAVALGALLVRVWTARLNLPYVDHPDEPNPINYVVGMLRTGDPNPHFFQKPSLYVYLLLAVLRAHYAWGLARGVYGPLDQMTITTHLYTTIPGFFLWGRMLTASIGALTVVWAYRVGRGIWSPLAGLIAALFVALSPFHMRHSQYVTTDVATAWLVLLAFGAALALARGGRWRDYLAAGAFVGLAASTKYNAGVVALMVVTAHLLGARRAWLARAPRLVAAGAAAALGFLAGTPYALLSWDEFRRGLLGQVKDYGEVSHGDFTGAWNVRGYLGFFWSEGLGPVACAAALAGIVLLIWGRRAGRNRTEDQPLEHESTKIQSKALEPAQSPQAGAPFDTRFALLRMLNGRTVRRPQAGLPSAQDEAIRSGMLKGRTLDPEGARPQAGSKGAMQPSSIARAGGLIWLSFVLPYLVLHMAQASHFNRNMVAVVVLCALPIGVAGAATIAALQRSALLWGASHFGCAGDEGRRTKDEPSRLKLGPSSFVLRPDVGGSTAPRLVGYLFGALICLALLVPSALETWRYSARLSRGDTRVQAIAWIDANVPPGVRVAAELRPLPGPAESRWAEAPSLPERDLAWYRRQGYAYLLASSDAWGQWDIPAAYRQLAGAPLAEFGGATPRDMLGPHLAIYATGLGPADTPLPVADARVGGARLAGVAVGRPTAKPPGLGINAADRVKAGQTLALRTFWEVEQPLGGDFFVFVHLVDAAGRTVAQRDTPPWQGRFPTSSWRPGTLVVDVNDIALPADLPAGIYTIAVGMFDPATGGQPPTSVAGRPAGAIEVGQVTVTR